MKHFLDWSAYKDAGMGDAYADIPKHGGDFAKAVAVCINSRICETHDKQVMCPSFKVSNDPDFSTGARVRLLKAALGDDLYETALANPALRKVMDLCVSCKGCKRECENNVDMPLIKAEYLAQLAKRDGFSWRARLFAETPKWLFSSTLMKQAVRLRNKSALIAGVMDRFLKVDRRVKLAEPAGLAFVDPTQVLEGDGDPEKPEVALLVDTFARYFEPAIADSALKVLKAGGYRVHFVTPAKGTSEPDRPVCCGRTYLAQGMIDKARHEAERLCQALMPHIEAGRTVVGLEASCVLGLRDDAKALGLGYDLEDISKKTFLFEEFLSKEIMAKRLDLPLKAMESELLVHGHCHQKAVGAMKAVRRVLKSIPDHKFTMIESGCCGMAGTFGIESEHGDMAKEMANQGLMPALKADQNSDVMANGFSCRSQIRSFGDDRPKHLAIILADLLQEA